MELLLIPVLLLSGAALLHMGVNGAPPFANPVTSLATVMSLKSIRLPVPPRAAGILSGTPGYTSAPKEVAFQLSDVLLADLLTEMVQFRQDLEALRNQVDALSTPPAKRPATASTRKKVASAA